MVSKINLSYLSNENKEVVEESGHSKKVTTFICINQTWSRVFPNAPEHSISHKLNNHPTESFKEENTECVHLLIPKILF